MADAWKLLTEDPRERAAFGSLAAVSALPASPAGPRNRLRDVLRLDTPLGRDFLKRFRRTQWKNRLRFALTPPRAADDAGRECAMTLALRASGHAAPRPIAMGRAGAAAYYLCAALPGRSLADALAHGVDGGLQQRAVRHAGCLLAAGFHLPDLSADHVFVAPDGGFAVLDLHNGTLAGAGPPPTRLLRRVLRRCRGSMRGVALAPRTALRCAASLLRAAGCSRAARRRLLAGQAPWSTALRYDVPGKSAAYAGRGPTRHARELRLLRQVWPGARGASVLDLPCGAGRLWPLLTDEFSARVLQADGSLAMLREAAAGHGGTPQALADALAMPFADRCVDGVVSFRFLHHLDRTASDRVIAECCRVARSFVVVSFFHPCSAHPLRRTVAQWLGRPSQRHARTLGAVDASFAAHGFARAGCAADLPFARDLWVAAYARAGGPV
ncbi:MAG: class I SAM-dependent methyltransferase [Planctomycetota bacterium]